MAIAGDPDAAPADDLEPQAEEAGAHDRGTATSSLRLHSAAREVAVPYVGQMYVCPRCRREIPPEALITLGKPAEFAHLLNSINRCPYCRFIFSYRSRAVVIRA